MTLKKRLERLERALGAREPVIYRMSWLDEDEEPEPGGYVIRLKWLDENEDEDEPTRTHNPA